MNRTVIFFLLVMILISVAYSGQDKNAPWSCQSNVTGFKPPKPPVEIQAISGRFFTGAAAGDWFGRSVATAGDVNGDGYSDLIVGANYNDAGGTNAGRVYVYFGGVLTDNSPDVMLTGAAAGDNFGYSVATAGDVNGDGYGDLIVGAYGNDAGGVDAGRAYVYFGGVSMDNTADVILTGAEAGELFGSSVASAGDVNGDGYSDLVVGAGGSDAGGTDAGRAYVYFGGAAMNITIDLILTGAAAGDLFGVSVAGAGDANGDGYSDLVVGAGGNDAGGADAGRAYIYFGGVLMDNTADVILTGASTGDGFGVSVAGAGDVNDDGYSDLIVGAYANDAAGTNAGRAYVYFGGAPTDNRADVTLSGAAAGDGFGVSVAGAGDVNGDGYGDVIVGAYWNDAEGANAGRAYGYSGGLTMDNLADVILTGAAAGDNFGISVAGAGDVNGDGYGDLIVGAYFNDAGGANAGRAYLFMNSLKGPDIADEYFTGEAAGDRFGSSVAGAGDVNGDGYGDFIVGAQLNDAGGVDAGRAYVYFGGVRMENTADVLLTGAVAGDNFGGSVAGAGDVNGDGYSDVIVGAYWNDAGGPSAGRAYVYFGSASMDNTADVLLTGEVAGDAFGHSVAGVGDVNGDGYSDLIVAAIFNDAGGSNAGRAYVYFGGALMDNTADVILTGEEVEGWFGCSVAAAGDVNRDGFSDLIVGANGNDAGGLSAGRAYVYFGGAAMDNTADVILTGEAANDWLGTSVAGAGDVNGDGYGDVIVGGGGSDVGGADAGRAYVYFGGARMENTADIILTGAAAGDYFGGSVAGVGDVNGDGYTDLIVGAYGNDAGGWRAGGAYTYFGGASMDNAADVTLTGAATVDYFGCSVAGAGDVNGDGYSDLIVGADRNDAGGDAAGRAYLYLSSAPPAVPRIASVKDVPDDQGGAVLVRWVRSGYDAKGIARITEYIVQRSLPPGASGFAWDNIATIPATQEAQYSYLASTPNDSMSSSGSGTWYFRVVARTSNALELWKSNAMSGHSVDNLAPLGVSTLVAEALGTSSIRLQWEPNTRDVDLSSYEVYRSTVSGFVPEETNRRESVRDTSWLDNALPAGAPAVYYRVCARDIHGNLSTPSAQVAVGLACTQSYPVADSWNMVSLPLDVSDYSKTVVYPTATSDAFAYNGVYTSEAVLADGKGYWLEFPAAQTVSLTGFGRVSTTVPLVNGWNLIGSLAAELSVEEIASAPPGLAVSPFYHWTGSSYAVAEVLEPHKGYWVKSSEVAELLLSLSGGQVSEARIRVIETSEIPPPPPFLTAVTEQQRDMPTVYSLEQNYPNPFNPSTTIRYGLPQRSMVRFAVFNLLGQQVATLIEGEINAGYHTVQFDASKLASGIYYYALQTGSYVQTRKLLLVR